MLADSLILSDFLSLKEIPCKYVNGLAYIADLLDDSPDIWLTSCKAVAPCFMIFLGLRPAKFCPDCTAGMFLVVPELIELECADYVKSICYQAILPI